MPGFNSYFCTTEINADGDKILQKQSDVNVPDAVLSRMKSALRLLQGHHHIHSSCISETAMFGQIKNTIKLLLVISNNELVSLTLLKGGEANTKTLTAELRKSTTAWPLFASTRVLVGRTQW